MDTTNASTNLTNPRHIWFDNVLTTAAVTVAQANPFREMLNRWYNAGEPVWMAADGLRIAVKERAAAIRREEMSDADGMKFIKDAYRNRNIV